MSNYDADRLYRLLPAVHRQRDADQAAELKLEKGPLRDLIEIIAGQAEILERDVLQLYENWFVETCEPWVIPYIGDLIGVRGTGGAGNRRSEVANTLGYRRAKGTAAVLEQLARDVTGWPARVVEYFERLETTQYANHIRLHNLRTPDLRRTNELELLGGPFETANHTLEVRRIAVGRGRYNVPNVGLFLWRLQAYPLEQVMPHSVDKRKFTFNVLGLPEPLFNTPEAETEASHIAEEINVPSPIRRRALHGNLGRYYGKGLSIEIFPDWQNGVKVENQQRLLPEEVVACDLTSWDRKLPADEADKVAVDPVLGRLRFPADKDPTKVRVSYHYGFSDDLGGGVYERASSFSPIEKAQLIPVSGTSETPTIVQALAKWGGQGSAVIEIQDSRTYSEDLGTIQIPAGQRLEIRAANEQRPYLHLIAPLVIHGQGENSRFEVNGLLIADRRLHATGSLDHLKIQHCTLVPRVLPTLVVDAVQADVVIERSIVGKLWSVEGTRVEIRDSILDATDPEATVYAGLQGVGWGGSVRISRSTVIGIVKTRELSLAENSIFLGTVTAERRQEGCVRFCHVPPGSRTPRRFYCQPVVPDGASPAEGEALAARVRPRFTSLRYGHPGYCQLTVDTPREIARGAEDESEMGVFSSLRQPQREDGLRIRLDEYLRVGLEAGIFFVT